MLFCFVFVIIKVFDGLCLYNYRTPRHATFRLPVQPLVLLFYPPPPSIGASFWFSSTTTTTKQRTWKWKWALVTGRAWTTALMDNQYYLPPSPQLMETCTFPIFWQLDESVSLIYPTPESTSLRVQRTRNKQWLQCKTLWLTLAPFGGIIWCSDGGWGTTIVINGPVIWSHTYSGSFQKRYFHCVIFWWHCPMWVPCNVELFVIEMMLPQAFSLLMLSNLHASAHLASWIHCSSQESQNHQELFRAHETTRWGDGVVYIALLHYSIVTITTSQN